MFMPGWTQILLVVLLIVLLFGRGKISDLMGDVAKGIKSFKKGLSDGEEEKTAKSPRTIEGGTKAETSHNQSEKADVS